MDLNDMFSLFSPDPLEGETLKYYSDLFEGRGLDPMKRLKRRLEQNPKGNQQILFSGYRGCGKSTELNKLIKDIENDFIVVKLSILDDLDPVNVNYVELVILTMEKLFETAKEYNISVKSALLESIRNWLNTAELEKVRNYSTEGGVEIGSETDFGIPFFTKFFAKIRMAANASYTVKKTVTEIIEQRLSDLMNYCNDLIREIKLGLAGINKKGLLMILEDMDKLDVDKSEELFYNHKEILTKLQANVVFTFPISLRHHIKFNEIRTSFNESFELPMVKIKDIKGADYPAGRNGLFALVTGRIGIEAFENSNLLYSFIDMSGGCIRDLFRMLRDAADNALDAGRNVINETDYRKSYLSLKRDYENTIAEKRDPQNEQILISVGQFFDALVSLNKSKTKKIDNTSATLSLLQNLCILGYNDIGWYDVHPVVKEILKERQPNG